MSVWGIEFRDWGLEYRVSDSIGFRVSDFGGASALGSGASALGFGF